jgi:hypothetical protein
MTDTSVKYFHSGMAGAPSLTNVAGTGIDVLDLLVNGMGLKSVTSLVVASNVATATVSGGHAFEVGTVALVAGATPGGLNGEWKVTATTATTIAFATTGIANQTATGTISIKLAGAGWTKAFTGTNKAAYQSADVAATGSYLRVDDTGPKMRVVGYEAMSDIDTGTGAFPTAAQRSGGGYWPKSSDSAAKQWILVADARTVYFMAAAYINYPNAFVVYAFGDLLATKSGDPYGAVLSSATVSSIDDVSTQDQYSYSNSYAATELYMARSYTGLGSSIVMVKAFASIASNGSQYPSGAVAGGPPFPNAADGGLYVVPHYVSESVTRVLRGVSPGFYACPQNIPAGQFAARDKVTGVTGLPGKTLVAATAYSGVFFIDITGPWR